MAQGSNLGPHSFHLMCSCVHVVCPSDCSLFDESHFPLSVHHLLSYHPVFPSARQLHLPGCGGQIPCALPPMRTLPPLPSATLFTSSTRTIGERTWTDVEPQEYSLSDYSVSKKLINLLRHGYLPREDDGAIEFWRTKDYLHNHFVYFHHWSDEKWKNSMARGGGNKKQFQYCTDSSGAILYLLALQDHSGRNLVDPSLQDNVVIPDGFFKFIYHVGCAINLHSIINLRLIPGGQNLSK